jgi:hypothetical protein
MTTQKTLRLGDHLSIPRSGGTYTHHGIYAGSNQVIHYTGDVKNKAHAAIKRTGLDAFLSGRSRSAIRVVKYAHCHSSSRTIEMAESRLGEDGYSLFGNNCEHFARWCKTGQSKSEQVKDVVSTSAAGAGSTAVTAAGLGVVSGTGAAAGLSGAGIMSGLATVGGTVGSGAVGGVAVLGAGPAVVTTLAMRRVLQDDKALPSRERKARAAGRAATVGGAVAGSAGSVAAISAVGTAGLSGAGITTGLAGIGATMGGGMVAGTAMTVAAPAVAAAAAGYGIYRAWRWLTH